MFSYTVMLIDLIDPDGFINTGQQRQHCQQPYADRSAENIVSVTPQSMRWLQDAFVTRAYPRGDVAEGSHYD